MIPGTYLDGFPGLLRDGIRVALLLPPRITPVRTGVGSFLLLAALLAALEAALQWHTVDAPRVVDLNGLQTSALHTLLQLAIAALLCALTQRRALFWTVASWLEASDLLTTLLQGVAAQAVGDDTTLSIALFFVSLLWAFAILLRLAWFLDRRALRALAASVLGLAIGVGPWFFVRHFDYWRADWSQVDDAYEQAGMLDDPEAAMYGLNTRIDAATAALAPQRPGVVDMYVLAFGGDASEDVFRNEVEYIERLFPQRFDAAGRVLSLLNHPASVTTRPLATATNLERGLAAIGARMDPAEDIVFVYLTSHGSEDHQLYVNQPPLPFDQVTPERLRSALDAAGIRWRVVVVSACYSGGFIEALRDPQTLVVTAARADRPSFGCGSASDITWFGNAFLVEALNRTADFREAYELAIAAIAEREKAEQFDPSEPQWDAGERVPGQLDAWRRGFMPGPAVEFLPNADIGQTVGSGTDADEIDAGETSADAHREPMGDIDNEQGTPAGR